MRSVTVRRGREKSILHRHPWVFQSALSGIEAGIEPGETVQVQDEAGAKLGFATCNPKSQITLRMLEWDKNITVDDAWWKTKLEASVERRKGLIVPGSDTACRLVYGESDFLPGLIADRYGDWIVLQSLTAGMEKRKHFAAEVLIGLTGAKGVYERSDADIRKLEGLPEVRGRLAGDTPPEEIPILENGVAYSVSLAEGQKTGFFLDQRRNRKLVSAYARGKNVLDCFCYSGGFTLNALREGALSVHAVDSSADALTLLRKNAEANQLDVGKITTAAVDVFNHLRRQRDEGKTYGLVVLDPPKLAPTKTHIDKAVKAYKDVNLSGIRLLEPGGILATFSCSGGLPMEEFRRIVGWAAHDAGREVQILQVLTQFEDHPVRMNYPESEYLKGLICRVI